MDRASVTASRESSLMRLVTYLACSSAIAGRSSRWTSSLLRTAAASSATSDFECLSGTVRMASFISWLPNGKSTIVVMMLNRLWMTAMPAGVAISPMKAKCTK